MKTPEQLKREASQLIREEHEKRLDREARDQRDVAILDAFDRLENGQPLASDDQPPPRHKPKLRAVP